MRSGAIESDRKREDANSLGQITLRARCNKRVPFVNFTVRPVRARERERERERERRTESSLLKAIMDSDNSIKQRLALLETRGNVTPTSGASPRAVKGVGTPRRELRR